MGFRLSTVINCLKEADKLKRFASSGIQMISSTPQSLIPSNVIPLEYQASIQEVTRVMGEFKNWKPVGQLSVLLPTSSPTVNGQLSQRPNGQSVAHVRRKGPVGPTGNKLRVEVGEFHLSTIFTEGGPPKGPLRWSHVWSVIAWDTPVGSQIIFLMRCPLWNKFGLT